MASINIKTSNSWKQVKQIFIKKSDNWTSVKTGWIKVSGTWKKFFDYLPSSTPIISTSSDLNTVTWSITFGTNTTSVKIEYGTSMSYGTTVYQGTNGGSTTSSSYSFPQTTPIYWRITPYNSITSTFGTAVTGVTKFTCPAMTVSSTTGTQTPAGFNFAITNWTTSSPDINISYSPSSTTSSSYGSPSGTNLPVFVTISDLNPGTVTLYYSYTSTVYNDGASASVTNSKSAPVPFGITSISSDSTSITYSWANAPSGTAFYRVWINSGSSIVVTGTTKTFSGLSSSMSYTVNVSAQNSSDSTIAYDYRIYSTTAAASPPATPIGLTVGGSGFVMWNSVAGATSYTVQYWLASSTTGANAFNAGTVNVGSNTSYQITYANNPSTGVYCNYADARVYASNGAGDSSWSAWYPSATTYV